MSGASINQLFYANYTTRDSAGSKSALSIPNETNKRNLYAAKRVKRSQCKSASCGSLPLFRCPKPWPPVSSKKTAQFLGLTNCSGQKATPSRSTDDVSV